MAGAATGLSGWGRAFALVLSLLSVLFLTNAPIQATMMAVSTGGDASVLCSTHTGKSGSDQSPVDRLVSCAACAVCHFGGIAILTNGARLVVSTAPSLIVRTILPGILGPRGPPTRAATARGPPTLP